MLFRNSKSGADRSERMINQGCHLPEPVGAGVFGWSRSRNFHPAPASTPTLQYLKYFVFTGHDYDYDYDCDYDNDDYDHESMTMTTKTMMTMTKTTTVTMTRGRGRSRSRSRNLPRAGKVKNYRLRQPWMISRMHAVSGSSFKKITSQE